MGRMDASKHSTDATAVLGDSYCPLTLSAAANLGRKGEELGQSAVSAMFKATEGSVVLKGDGVEFVGTGSQLDRDDDVIKAAGVDHAGWEKRPVILFSHDSRQRIGRGNSIERKGRNWVIGADYYPASISPLAGALKAMLDWNLQNKALRDTGAAFSVGFRALEANFVPDRGQFGGFDFERIEVLEYSDVSLPSNPAALLRAKGDGVRIGALCDWAEAVRKEMGRAEVNADFAQGLVELIDPTKGLKVFELTPKHLEHLKYDPPAEPEPAGEPDPEPTAAASIAYVAASKGMSPEDTNDLLKAAGCQPIEAPEPEPAAAIASEKKEPSSADDWQDAIFLRPDNNGLPATGHLKAALAAVLTDEDLDDLFIDRHAAKTGHLPEH